jgi:hypothetical protein
LGQAQNAAASPFNLPTQPVAGFTPQQQQAFGQYGAMQGMYQPYYNQAAGLMQQSAAGPQVGQFMNPYANYVMGNLAEQQGQQMQQLTGQATQTAGGVGADRIGVAQGELARQQNLASGQTLAGIYGSALGAAQQQQQLQQSAGYGLGQLGGANLQSALAATGALYGSGAYQQQLNQAQLNAQYQNQLQQQAYPFQTAQYLAGITSGLAGAMGATSNQYGTGTYTPPPPSVLGQVAGLGMAGLGAYGAFSGAGGTGGASYLDPGTTYNTGNGMISAGGPAGPTPFYARGGRFADGGDTSSDGSDGTSQSDKDWYYSDIQPSAKNITSKLAGQRGNVNWESSDPAVPAGQVQRALSAQQALNLPNITPMQMPQQGSGSSTTGDISNILGDVAKIAPLLMANRGGRMPYPRAYQDGGDVDDFSDRFGALGSIDKRWPDDPAASFNQRTLASFPNARDPQAEASALIRQKILARNDAADKADQALRAQGTAALRPAMEKSFPTTPPAPIPEGTPITSGPGSPSDPYLQPSPDAPRAIDSVKLATGAGGAPYPASEVPPGDPRRLQVNQKPQVADRPSPTADPNALPTWREIQAQNQKELQNYVVPYPGAPSDQSTGIARNPWMALMAAGFGTMASGSPYPGVAIGKGGLQGVQFLEKQRQDAQQEESLNQRARQLQMEALKYTSMTPHEAADMAYKQAVLEQGKYDVGYNQDDGRPFFWNKKDPTDAHYMDGSPVNPQTAIQGARQPTPAQAVAPTPPTPQGTPPVTGTPAPGTPAAAQVAGPPGVGVSVPRPGTVPGQAPLASQPQQAPALPPAVPQQVDPEYNTPETRSFGYASPGPVHVGEYQPRRFTGPRGSLDPNIARTSNKMKLDAGNAVEGANDQLTQLKTLRNEYDKVDTEGGPWMKTGAFGPQRAEYAKMANGIVNGIFGDEVNMFSPDAIGATENIKKLNTFMGGAGARTLGAREAQQVIQSYIDANPGLQQTPAGRRTLLASLEAAAERKRDYGRFILEYANRPGAGGDATGAQDAFARANPVSKYVERAEYNALSPADKESLKRAVPKLIANKNDPEAVKLFDKYYNGLSKHYLRGQ